MSHPSDPSRQGVALVLVLVFLLSLTGLVMLTLGKSSKGALEVSTLPPEYQADVLAESAVAMAQELLLQDNDPTSDTLFEPWARPYQSDSLSFRIIPANAYLDLNKIQPLPVENSTSLSTSLVDTSFGSSSKSNIRDSRMGASNAKTKDEEAKEASKTLNQAKEAASKRQTYRMELAMETLLGNTPDKALLIENVRDWKHNSTEAFRKLPAYHAKQPSYLPRFDAMAVPEELNLVLGWETIPASSIRRYFTVWNPKNQINLNFASQDVIRAFLPELARHMDSILFWREQRGFTHVSQLLSATTMTSDGEEYGAVLPNLTVTSHLFQVEAEARAAGCLIRKRYILSRNSLRPGDKPSLVHQDTLEIRFDQN